MSRTVVVDQNSVLLPSSVPATVLSIRSYRDTYWASPEVRAAIGVQKADAGRLSPEEVQKLKWKLPLFPAIPIACVLLIGVAIIAPIFQNQPGIWVINAGGLPVVGGAIWMAIWATYYFAYGRRLRAAAETAAETVVEPVTP